MIAFKFDLEKQVEYYSNVKEKLKTQFYQNLHFYILPTMPEKFRNRVVYFPETCEPEKIYKKHKRKIAQLEKLWKTKQKKFINKLIVFFPKLDSLNILVSPTLYDSLGSFEINNNKIIIKPRYDRSLIEVQKLVINALVKYYSPNLSWTEKQNAAANIQDRIFPNKKSMIKILDTEFAGGLAEESAKYLEKLGVDSKTQITKPDNLTKNENKILNLLLRNKNKLVSFEEISEWLWRDNADEKYSEYAITKLIERLKKKLPKNVIHNQRGVGYVLYI